MQIPLGIWVQFSRFGEILEIRVVRLGGGPATLRDGLWGGKQCLRAFYAVYARLQQFLRIFDVFQTKNCSTGTPVDSTHLS